MSCGYITQCVFRETRIKVKAMRNSYMKRLEREKGCTQANLLLVSVSLILQYHFDPKLYTLYTYT